MRSVRTRDRVQDANDIIENILFVISKLLLIKCVQFCVSRINTQQSRTSMDLEQFTECKIDAAWDLRVQLVDAPIEVQ